MNVGVNVLSLFALLMACEKCACLKNDPCTTTSYRAGRCVPYDECPVGKSGSSNSTIYQGDLNTLIAHLGACGSKLKTDPKDALVCCDTSIHRTTTASPSSKPAPVNPKSSNYRTLTVTPTSETPNLRKILPKVCGRLTAAPHTFGGTEDENEVHRWSVFLDLGSQGRDRCVGSVITDRHVLTAAHCLDNKGPNDITMYFGIYNLSNMENCRLGDVCQKRKPSKFIIHELYNNTLNTNDIAIIRFDEPLDFTDFIEPICLPQNVTYDPESFKPEMENGVVFHLLAFGWGEMGGGVLSDIRRVVMLNVTTQDGCEKSVSSKTMCTLGYVKGSDVCQGDSGSPLVWHYKRLMYVVGVVKSGPVCGMNPGMPSIAMRISHYMDWIKNEITKIYLD